MENPQDTKPQKQNNREKKEGHREKKESNRDRPRKPREEKVGQEGAKPKRDKAPRFQYPKDWKEEIDKNVNLETKIPALPKDAELKSKPDLEALKKSKTDLQNKIEKTLKTIDNLKEEQKTLREEIWKKNNSAFAELKDHKAVRNALLDKMNENKAQKQKLQAEIDAVDAKMAQLHKKAIGGKIMNKNEIEKLIKAKEEAYRNKQHTSAEEKAHIDEMRELKVNLPLMSENETLRKQKDAIDEKMKALKKEGHALFEKIQECSGKINQVKAKLDQQENTKKDEKPADEGAQKAKRELTQPEKEIREKIDKLYDDISRMRDKKSELSKKFDAEMLEYDMQQFEVQKINYMIKVQKRFKAEEFRKKRQEEDEAFRKEEEEKAKELLQFKYRHEVETCEGLIRILKTFKPSNIVVDDFKPETITEYKVDDQMLKSENLVLMKPKKNQDEGVKPGQKKVNKKVQKKTVDNKDDDKLFLDIATLQTFTDIKVMPPTTVTQIDAVIANLNEKKNYFLKLREEETEKALAAPKEEKKAEGEVHEEQKEQKDHKEKRGGREGRKEQSKKVEMNEADFPSLG
jgi:hypothetical protein